MKRDTEPFDPRLDIRVNDVRHIDRMMIDRPSLLFARDVSICFPEKRGLLHIPPQTFDERTQDINRDASAIQSELDIFRILDRAAALKHLFPGLDPNVFNDAKFLRQPFLEYQREVLLKEQERAQNEREKGTNMVYPRWFHGGAREVAAFANFQTITQGSQFALELSFADEQEAMQIFRFRAELIKPEFGTRLESVAQALEVGAALKTIDPDVQLPSVNPEFWRDVKNLLRETRDATLREVKWFNPTAILKNNLIPYMRQVRQATVLAGQIAH